MCDSSSVDLHPNQLRLRREDSPTELIISWTIPRQLNAAAITMDPCSGELCSEESSLAHSQEYVYVNRVRSHVD